MIFRILYCCKQCDWECVAETVCSTHYFYCIKFSKKKKRGKKNGSSSKESGSDNEVEVIKVWNSRSRGGGEGSTEDKIAEPTVAKIEEGENLVYYLNGVRVKLLNICITHKSMYRTLLFR